MKISKLIQKQPAFHARGAVSDEDIKTAENTLGLQFAQDYREYVAAFGAASFAGHELTGVCGSKRLNVVPVTFEERNNTAVPSDWYVLEQANIDGIVLWQDRSGAVYQTAPHIKPRKFCGSLAEYIEL